jgi:hypothetical protein
VKIMIGKSHVGALEVMLSDEQMRGLIGWPAKPT